MIALNADPDSEAERARRRRDEAARLSEYTDVGAVGDFDMSSLKERIDLIETKETQLSEIKEKLQIMQSGIGIRFVSDENEILPAAWAFVALNIVLACYSLKVLLVDPLITSVSAPF